MVIKMVKDGMKLSIYDEFQIGVMQTSEGEMDDQFLNLTFGENDRGDVHVFKIHKSKIDDFVDMIRQHSGKRVHIATEMPKGPNGTNL